MSHTLVLVEDDPAIASTLQFALEREGWQVTWVNTASSVLPTLAKLSQLSAIIMDVGLPDGEGFTVCQQVRFGQHHATVPILFLTARSDEIDKIIGLEMGGDDYITKPFSPREVVARLKAIWRRQAMSTEPTKTNANDAKRIAAQNTTPLSANASQAYASSHHLCADFCVTLASGTWDYRDAIFQLCWEEQPLALSKTELAIMLTLLQHPHHILSREQILSHISDYPEHRLARTIDSHIKALRQKLAQYRPDIEVIITHRGLGYSLAHG